MYHNPSDTGKNILRIKVEPGGCISNATGDLINPTAERLSPEAVRCIRPADACNHQT